MARFLKSTEGKVGKSPDDLVFVGKQRIDKPLIRIMDFDKENLKEIETDNPEDCRAFLQSETVTWISVYGLHEPEIIKRVGEIFGIHTLALEDIVNTAQRAKLEEYDDMLFLVLKMLRTDEETEHVRSSQLSLVIGDNFLISFHEEQVDLFHSARERVRRHKGRIRKSGPDYLAYTMVDIIVDHYMIVLERIGSRIEDIEEAVLEEPTHETLNRITHYKHEVNYLRKTIRPARELIIQISKLDSDVISEQSQPFWKDLLGITIQATEVLDSYREMLSDHLNIYNTSVSNKLNEIMKVLTIFAAIFIPLTFIAGIYGTNFEYLPELHWRYSYFVFLGVMAGIAVLMVRYFKRKGWM